MVKNHKHNIHVTCVPTVDSLSSEEVSLKSDQKFIRIHVNKKGTDVQTSGR